MNIPSVTCIQPVGVADGPDGWFLWLDMAGDRSDIRGPFWVAAVAS